MHHDSQGPSSLREFIRARREELNLTQVDIARAVGVTSGDFISLVEKGIRKLDLDRIPRLAEVLNTDAATVARMAIEEQYPLLAKTLFDYKVQRIPVQSETEVAAKKLSQLPRHVRRMALSMIDVLFEKEFDHSKAAAA